MVMRKHRTNTLTERQHKCKTGALLGKKWLMVLIKSGPINTIFERGDIDPPRGHMSTLSLEQHH